MKYYDDMHKLSVSFLAKEHSKALGNSEECRMFSHIHPSAELLFVTSGEIVLHFQGRESEHITAGRCALLFPFQPHAYDRCEGTEYFRVNFMPSLIQSFFAPNEKNMGERAVFSVNPAEYEPFFMTVRTGKLSYFKVKGFLYNIIGDYARQIPFFKKSVDDNVLSKVVAYVNEHKSEALTIKGTAQALGYNEKYLSRCVNQSAGFGFSTLVSMLRMEAASYLLKNTSRTIVDIALECGFGSERTFYRQFKEQTGMTPREYRESVPKLPTVNDAVL